MEVTMNTVICTLLISLLALSAGQHDAHAASRPDNQAGTKRVRSFTLDKHGHVVEETATKKARIDDNVDGGTPAPAAPVAATPGAPTGNAAVASEAGESKAPVTPAPATPPVVTPLSSPAAAAHDAPAPKTTVTATAVTPAPSAHGAPTSARKRSRASTDYDTTAKFYRKNTPNADVKTAGALSETITRHGINNFNNTSCYLIATLQCLASLQTEPRDAKAPEYLKTIHKVITRLRTGKPVPDTLMKKCFELQAQEIFANNTGQQDAQECLTKIIAGSKLFELDIPSELTCDKGHTRTRDESTDESKTEDKGLSTTLQLALPEQTTPLALNTLIEIFFRPEELIQTMTGDNRATCPTCDPKAKTKATKTTKQFKLDRLNAQNIVIQLKRFDTRGHAGDYVAKKINTPVTSVSQITLNKITYNLTGIVYHKGTLRNGHYTAHTRLNDGSWVYCNDSRVIPNSKPTDLGPTEDFTPYLFFFTKANGKPASLPQYTREKPAKLRTAAAKAKAKAAHDKSESKEPVTHDKDKDTENTDEKAVVIRKAQNASPLLTLPTALQNKIIGFYADNPNCNKLYDIGGLRNSSRLAKNAIDNYVNPAKQKHRELLAQKNGTLLGLPDDILHNILSFVDTKALALGDDKESKMSVLAHTCRLAKRRELDILRQEMQAELLEIFSLPVKSDITTGQSVERRMKHVTTEALRINLNDVAFECFLPLIVFGSYVASIIEKVLTADNRTLVILWFTGHTDSIENYLNRILGEYFTPEQTSSDIQQIGINLIANMTKDLPSDGSSNIERARIEKLVKIVCHFVELINHRVFSSDNLKLLIRSLRSKIPLVMNLITRKKRHTYNPFEFEPDYESLHRREYSLMTDFENILNLGTSGDYRLKATSLFEKVLGSKNIEFLNTIDQIGNKVLMGFIKYKILDICLDSMFPYFNESWKEKRYPDSNRRPAILCQKLVRDLIKLDTELFNGKLGVKTILRKKISDSNHWYNFPFLAGLLQSPDTLELCDPKYFFRMFEHAAKELDYELLDLCLARLPYYIPKFDDKDGERLIEIYKTWHMNTDEGHFSIQALEVLCEHADAFDLNDFLSSDAFTKKELAAMHKIVSLRATDTNNIDREDFVDLQKKIENTKSLEAAFKEYDEIGSIPPVVIRPGVTSLKSPAAPTDWINKIYVLGQGQ